MKLSTDDRLQKLQELVAIPYEILSGTSKRELDKKVSGLISKPRDFSKAELLDEIDELVYELRQQAKLKLEAELLALREKELEQREREAALENGNTPVLTREAVRKSTSLYTPDEVFKTLQDAILLETDHNAIIAKAYSLAGRWFASNMKCYSVKTVKSYINDLQNRFIEMYEEIPDTNSAKSNYVTAGKAFCRQLKVLFKDDYADIKKEYSQTVFHRVDQLVDIDPTALLSTAKETLENPLATWKDLAIALAIVTGRRQAEIMATARFSYVSENVLSFAGIAKKKTTKGKEEVRDIPCLVDSSLVINAMQRLEETGKRLKDPDDVNDCYAKLLSREVSRWQSRCCPDVKLTYKSLRALYATLCYSRFSNGHQDLETYLSNILGHNQGDLNTAKSYKVFRLVFD